MITIFADWLIYEVQLGDDMTELAERLGLTVEAIAAANGMSQPRDLLVGEVLAIPGIVYIVQSDDDLSDIAAALGVPLEVIMIANSITDPGEIFAGQELAIPGG